MHCVHIKSRSSWFFFLYTMDHQRLPTRSCLWCHCLCKTFPHCHNSFMGFYFSLISLISLLGCCREGRFRRSHCNMEHSNVIFPKHNSLVEAANQQFRANFTGLCRLLSKETIVMPNSAIFHYPLARRMDYLCVSSVTRSNKKKQCWKCGKTVIGSHCNRKFVSIANNRNSACHNCHSKLEIS